jgi:phosphopantetheine adenylyltransferase
VQGAHCTQRHESKRKDVSGTATELHQEIDAITLHAQHISGSISADLVRSVHSFMGSGLTAITTCKINKIK